MRYLVAQILVLVVRVLLAPTTAEAQRETVPPLLSHDREVALALSAAPDEIAGDAAV